MDASRHLASGYSPDARRTYEDSYLSVRARETTALSVAVDIAHASTRPAAALAVQSLQFPCVWIPGG